MKKALALGLFAFLCSWFVFAEPNLSGKWKFNEKQSDDPHEKFQQAMRDNHHSGGGFEGGHGMPSGGFGGGRGSGDFRGRQGDNGEHQHMFEAPVELTISNNASVFRTIDNTGTDRSLYTDGRKNEIEMEGGRKLIATAHWEEDQLVVETQGQKGGTIRQTYELSPDSKQLFVKLRIPTPFSDEPIQIIRVYDAVPLEPSPQSTPATPPGPSGNH